MSRLESNAEPSMEEILASIRKIIAEEPPGSRPMPSAPSPGAAATPAPSPQRGFMSREAFMRSSTPAEPEFDEPGLGAESSRLSPDTRNGVQPAPSNSGREEGRSDAAVFPKGSSAADEPPAARASEPAKDAEPEPASIEAQLVDLLGDDLNALNGATLVDAGSDTGHASDAAPLARQEVADPEPRPGFSVSRIGFTAESAENRESSDPFAFDLGPSPFLSRPPAASAAEIQKLAPIAPPVAAPVHVEPEPGVGRKLAANGTAVSATTTQPSGPEPAPAPIPAPAARPSEPFAVPSVAATLGPSRNLEPLSAAFQSAPAERQPSQQPSHISPPSEYTRNAVELSGTRRDQPETMLQPAYKSDDKLDRAIEDTVADLLRPMLRTWLAENMPKIVERALRREISERLLPGQKNSFE
jgi:cell pole-organizing protein PopZ